MYAIRSSTYLSYALNLVHFEELCLSNLCATDPSIYIEVKDAMVCKSGFLMRNGITDKFMKNERE